MALPITINSLPIKRCVEQLSYDTIKSDLIFKIEQM